MPLTPEALEFLFVNRINDSRDWFQQHKPQFKSLVEAPLLALSQALAGAALQVDPRVVTEPRRTVSRIWRDTRFTKDKTTFRDVMWIVFHRGQGMYHPGFFFQFSPRGFQYGCGYYDTPPKVAAVMRQMILQDDRRFLAAQKALASAGDLALSGECYKKPRFPQAPGEKRAWLELRSFVVSHSSEDTGALYDPGLAERLSKAFLRLAPVYTFMMDAHLQVFGDRDDLRR